MSMDLYEIGELPPLGEVPAQMYASVIRSERFNQDQPKEAFQIEAVAVPEIEPSEVLVAVMAAGVNYNNVWAARGIPVGHQSALLDGFLNASGVAASSSPMKRLQPTTSAARIAARRRYIAYLPRKEEY